VPNLNHDLCSLDVLLSKVRLGPRTKISNRACCAMVVLLSRWSDIFSSIAMSLHIILFLYHWHHPKAYISFMHYSDRDAGGRTR
jgi:hypothetical protein